MESLLSKIGFNMAIADGSIGKGYDWGQASNVALCGVAIVFLMLILLVVAIIIFGKIMDSANGTSKPKAPKPQKKVAQKPVAVPAPVAATSNIPSETEDDVIAAIAAAVGYLYSGSDVKPVIRAIRPSNNKAQRSAWANAGVIQNTRAF